MISAITVPTGARHKRLLLKLSFLGLAFCLAFGLRLLYVRQISPFVDEYISILATQAIIDHGTPVLPSGLFYGPKALLHSYIMALAFWLFGSSEFAARLPSVVAGVLAVGVIYRAGRDWFSPVVGFSAAVALTWLPAAVLWGGRARMYGLFQFLSLLGVYLLINGYLENRGRGARVAGMLIMLLAIFAHTLALIVLGSVVAGVIVSRWMAPAKSEPIWPPSWSEIGAGLILVGGVLLLNPMGGPWGAESRLSETAYGSFDLQTRIFYLVAFTHQFVVWPLWPLTIFYATGFISLMLRLIKKSPIAGDRLALCLYSLIFCAWFVTSVISKFHDDRYLFGIVPFYLLLALREFCLMLKAVLKSVRFGSVRPGPFGLAGLISVLLIALFVPSIIQLVTTDTFGFATAYRYVQDHWQAGDVVATCSPAPGQLVLNRTDYYVIQYGTEVSQGRDIWTGAPLIDTPEKFAAVLADQPRVWFVVEKLCWERHFDADFVDVVYSNMEVAFDYKGMLVFVSKKNVKS